jgi:hypothetical protein
MFGGDMARVRNQRCIDPGAVTLPDGRDVLDGTPPVSSDQVGVDELLEFIENSAPDARFVPELSGEWYKNAA